MRIRTCHKIQVLCLLCALGQPAAARPVPDKGIHAVRLACEMRCDPQGIDALHPRLSWEVAGQRRDIRQTAYQVLVASTPEKLRRNDGDLWSTGKINRSASIQIPYEGRTLSAGTRCFWKVRIWTTKGASPWSAPASWSMGLLSTRDWHGRWIGLDRAFPWDSAETLFSRLSARYFRKAFRATGPVERATLSISGLGFYDLYINGRRIGDQVLAPIPTDYTKRVLYNTFDVTSALQHGENVLGVVLGNGLFFTMRQHYKPDKIKNFGYPKMLLELDIHYHDGTTRRVVSDSTWKVTADGPVRSDNLYDGEEYDATREMPGWNLPGFDDRRWLKAQHVQPPGGRLEAEMEEPVNVMDTLRPVSLHYLRPGVYILDMGQNMTGWLRIHVTGKRGQAVTLRFAESLQANGEVATANLRDARATDVYRLKGEGEESWAPDFVYHGFRYVEISGYPGTPALSDFTGEVVYNAVRSTGSFRSDNEILNQVYHNAEWSILGDYKGIPVDCPQRNERMPWLGDRAVSAYGESFVADNEKLYASWLRDIDEAQTPDGVIPDVAPAFWHYYTDDVTWPATFFTVAAMLYRQYGDLRPLSAHYGSMCRWLSHIREKYMRDDLIPRDKYGDWCMPPAVTDLIHATDSDRITDGTLIATAYYYHLLRLTSRSARLLDKPGEARSFDSLADRIRLAFNRKFLDDSKGYYSNGTVTANILPLYFGITPQKDTGRVFAHIVRTITDVYHRHVSTGVIGTAWLMRTLTRYGRPDLAADLATTTSYPGWGYMAASGATTTWELWNGNKANPRMSSRNHVMLLGDLVVWLYEDVAGIKTAPDEPGFGGIVMKPGLTDSVRYVDAAYHSVHGLISSRWKAEGTRFVWDVMIPGNTHALVYVPNITAAAITESGRPAKQATGVRFVAEKDGYALYRVGSGHYHFESILPTSSNTLLRSSKKENL